MHAREHANSHWPCHTRMHSHTNTHPRSITYAGFGSEIRDIVRPAQVVCLFCKEIPALLHVHAHVRLFLLKMTHHSENGEIVQKLYHFAVLFPPRGERKLYQVRKIGLGPNRIWYKFLLPRWRYQQSGILTLFLRCLGGNFQRNLSCVTFRV